MTGWIGRFAAYGPVFLMAHGDDRDDDFLQHGTTVNEACTTREMKAVGPFGNPEFHATFGHCGDECRPVPGLVRFGQVMADQVAFLGLTVPGGFSVRALRSGAPGASR